MFLLTDTGGTNTRLALADASGIWADTVQSVRNADFPGFQQVIDTYLAAQPAIDLSACCFAFAGPVRGRAPRLTNLSWQIDAEALEHRLGAQVFLMNDLEAMGRAIPGLTSADLQPITHSPNDEANGQILAVGLGTGMNVCAVKTRANTSVEVWACEYGHSPLPASLHVDMKTAGVDMDRYPNVEHVFSGRGLAALQAAGISDDVYCAWLASICAALSAQFLPMSGLYLAGGVSRAILTSADPALFDHHLSAALPQNLAKPPVSLITSDSAALQGCLARLLST